MKTELYRATLRTLSEWEPFLLRESGLPGPRANLELVQAVADEGSEAQFRRWLELGPDRAPTNSPEVFLAVCGIVGLGRLLAGGQASVWPLLRQYAADPRWRLREGVAMALQRLGAVNMDALLAEMAGWSRGNLLEQRAAAAALCEPALLRQEQHARLVLEILDTITTGLGQVADRKSEEFKVLRQGLAYCWSVAVVALPGEGKPLLEKWLASPDKDIRWIMQENLKKNRLSRMDRAWVEACQARLERGRGGDAA